MLGHELRNPLSPILTALHLMRMRGGETREQAVIERQVGHLVRLVDDLLDVSRITRGKIELRRENLELGAAVAAGLEMARPLLEQRRQRLDLDVPAEGLLLHARSEPAGAGRVQPPDERGQVQRSRSRRSTCAAAAKATGSGCPCATRASGCRPTC